MNVTDWKSKSHLWGVKELRRSHRNSVFIIISSLFPIRTQERASGRLTKLRETDVGRTGARLPPETLASLRRPSPLIDPHTLPAGRMNGRWGLAGAGAALSLPRHLRFSPCTSTSKSHRSASKWPQCLTATSIITFNPSNVPSSELSETQTQCVNP